MAEARTIHIKIRGCGERKEGQVYLVSEPGGGVLPLWMPIDPAVVYCGEQFRGLIYVVLGKILEGEPYLADASLERERKGILQEPEEGLFGMPLVTRQSIGICRTNGMEALASVYILDARRLGACLRYLGRVVQGISSAEIPAAFREWQKGNHTGILAALWRLWRRSSENQRNSIKSTVFMAMKLLNAEGDAWEL